MVLQLAFRALRRNMLRTFLTTLGIIIGVASVITMVAIGQGAKESIRASIASMGVNILFISPSSPNRGGVSLGAAQGVSLTDEDAAAIASECSYVRYISPTVQTSYQIVYGNLNWSASIIGCNADYLSIRDWPLFTGEFLSEQEVRTAAKVCVIGKTVTDRLFPTGQDPVGEIIRIKKVPFRIIGTLIPRGQSSFGQDQDNVVMIPYTSAQKRIAGRTRWLTFMVSAVTQDLMVPAQEQIRDLLRQRHKLRPEDEDNFSIRNQTDIANMASSTAQVMTLLLGSIASISLLVGGIGIMNIMLVSVTERTREIGIRMAVGAKEKDIMLQFLAESIVISLTGGIVGIILGTFFSWAISLLLNWRTSVSLSSVVLSFLFSALVGVFFGYQPARKAAKLNPIEALRYE